MGIVLISVFIIITILYRFRYGDWANPVSLMSGIWAFVLIIYESGIVKLNAVSEYTYIIMLVGILAFSFGASFFKNKRFVFGKIGNNSAGNNFVVNYKAVLILELLTIAIYMPDVINTIVQLLSGVRFTLIRSQSNISVISNPLIGAISNYITQPFAIFAYPIAAYSILTINEEKDTKSIKVWIFILAVGISMCQTFASGIRLAMVYIFVHLFVISKMMEKQITIPKVIKALIGVVAISAFIVLYYISLSRGIEDVGASYALYACGCVPLLDHYVLETISSGIYTNGGAFFYGIINLFFTILGNIGISEPQFLTELTRNLFVENNVMIGPMTSMNAYVSWFYYLFKDGGFLTLIFGAFIYGGVSCLSYRRARGERNLRRAVFYSILANTIVFSIIRFHFIKYHYLLSFIFLFILIKHVPVGGETHE